MRSPATTDTRPTLEAWVLSRFEGLEQEVLLMFARGQRARDAIRAIEAHERARNGHCSPEQAHTTFHRIVAEAAPKLGAWLESWDTEAHGAEAGSPAGSDRTESDLAEYPPMSDGVIDPAREIATREASADDPTEALIREITARSKAKLGIPDGP